MTQREVLIDRTIVQEVCNVLVVFLAPGFATAEAEYDAVGDRSFARLTLHTRSAESQEIAVPEHAENLLKELRDKMYEPGKGTWWSATIRIDRAGSYSARFNYEQPPPFPDGLPSAAEFAVDHRRYPRDPEHRPPWLGSMLPGAGAAEN
ncbi:hypothetical protein [Microbacterium aoyamense]|nr:hypothetical protein [Microbacterium aoyamense]